MYDDDLQYKKHDLQILSADLNLRKIPLSVPHFLPPDVCRWHFRILLCREGRQYHEYIILKLIEKSVNKNVAIAMLCKTSVARNVLLELDRNDVCVDDLRIYNFDSSKVFGISAPACLLYIKMSTSNSKCRECEVYDI